MKEKFEKIIKIEKKIINYFLLFIIIIIGLLIINPGILLKFSFFLHINDKIFPSINKDIQVKGNIFNLKINNFIYKNNNEIIYKCKNINIKTNLSETLISKYLILNNLNFNCEFVKSSLNVTDNNKKENKLQKYFLNNFDNLYIKSLSGNIDVLKINLSKINNINVTGKDINFIIKKFNKFNFSI